MAYYQPPSPPGTAYPSPATVAQPIYVPPQFAPEDKVRTLFVAGLPKPREIYHLFRECPGYQSSNLRPPTSSNNQPFAFATFVNKQSAIMALHAINVRILLCYFNLSCSKSRNTIFLCGGIVLVGVWDILRSLVHKYIIYDDSFSSPALLAKSNTQCRNINKKVDCKGISNDKIRRKNLAVSVSGGGSNFRSIHEATLNGSVHGDVVVLVTNKQDCGGAEYARDKRIPLIVFPRKKDEQKSFSAEDLVNTLRSYKVDFILLAGYLKLIPVELVRAYPKSILNIHPSLLPAFGGKGFYGMKVHRAVIASGARYSGPTIHYVDEQYDMGRILAQRVVPVLANDTAEKLAARVLHEEHQLYVDVAAAICEERIVWREDGVPLIRGKENPNHYL